MTTCLPSNAPIQFGKLHCLSKPYSLKFFPGYGRRRYVFRGKASSPTITFSGHSLKFCPGVHSTYLLPKFFRASSWNIFHHHCCDPMSTTVKQC